RRPNCTAARCTSSGRCRRAPEFSTRSPAGPPAARAPGAVRVYPRPRATPRSPRGMRPGAREGEAHMGTEPIAGIEERGRRPPLARVVSGFLSGLGFSFALAGTALIALVLSRRYVCPLAPAREARPIHEGWPKPFGPDSRLTVASFQPRRTKDNVILVAAVKN